MKLASSAVAAAVFFLISVVVSQPHDHHEDEDRNTFSLRGNLDPAHESTTPRRDLSTNCVGDRLQANDILEPNESICANVGGEDVYFGIFTADMVEPGYTMYRVELRSSSENPDYNRFFRGIGTQGDAPNLKLQGDGNLLFGSQGFSGCIAMPGTAGNELTIGEDGNGQLLLQITDSTGEVIWILSAGECYPLVENSCTPVLHKDERLGWKEFLCTYDENGEVEYRFGLNHDVGLFGLWKGSSLIWRPSGSGTWLRADYLHFQDDGHLSLYRDTSPKTYLWTSGDCIDFTAEKLVFTSDGDVQELNYDGAIVWSLQGSKAPPEAAQDPRDSVPEVCMPQPSCAVPPTTPLFVIDDDVDIGDILGYPTPAFARSCGPRCYDVKDNGDDPPFDPEYGDTLRFAYKEVSSTKFVFRAKVCGTNCDDEPWAWDKGYLGSVGLMVREGLDPMDKNLFVSHEPHGQATWSYRLDTNGPSIRGFDGSPDVECLWITLERQSRDVFRFLYNYEGNDRCTREEGDLLDTTITIDDMPETVLLGLGVSSGIAPPYCAFTEARFSEIEFDEE
eukprot:CAMPEP_0117003574 /NCGR_PEP_ID=MMETSP0472-20121206/4843_1 /TAXON_ID=693140 ORGANISM="Tiarina fusus, Strain LIS" /NCGR_SAMPLE_ID=MMETSP0472 /ASSEMBLY_ACC=CAM_ASM_000603 /LENGTH=560 /DNA_ID=CAMNT_0004704257 /DNA_START=125 /DNA_END=1807 /DNA_ORIENTATION=-